MMQSGNFITEPKSRTIGVVTVSAVLQHDPANDIWSVIIVLSRSPGQELVKGEEVNVLLFGRQGIAWPVIERPSGPLTEAGGSRGVSANARFRFQSSKESPELLVVMYQSQSVSFSIILKEPAMLERRKK
jgi:hypothetical protein